MQLLDNLSPRDLALALGVSESSVRRWVDGGAIPSRRTPGGHRRIGLADAIAYARGAGIPIERPEALGLGPADPAGAEPAEAFHDALRKGHEREASGLLLGAYAAGNDVAELCDRWIRPGLARIGELWRGGTAGILVEHRATSICTALLHRLRTLVGDGGGLRALGGAVAGDPYALPSLMAAVVLQGEGFTSTDLGANTPPAVLREAIAEQDPHLLWIGVGHVAEQGAVRSGLQTLLEETARTGLPVVLGGRCLEELDLPRLSNVHRASSMRELKALGLGIRSASNS